MGKKSNGLIKMGVVLGIIILLFGLIIGLTKWSDKEKLKNNPYDTEELHPETINLLSNEHYQNIILPGELDKKIQSGDTVFAYIFNPTCQYCKMFTPKLMPIAEEYGVHIDQLNVLEYPEEWNKYSIQATPTLIVFEDGKEVERIVGDFPESEIHSFFENIKK